MLNYFNFVDVGIDGKPRGRNPPNHRVITPKLVPAGWDFTSDEDEDKSGEQMEVVEVEVEEEVENKKKKKRTGRKGKGSEENRQE